MKDYPEVNPANEILISVIIPVYNIADFLPRCLDSVCGQTLSAIEVIVVNDGSTDCSLNVLSEYQQRDDRVIIIDQQNAGVSVARNRGLAKAKGKYILFVDGDDYIEKYTCELLYKNIEETKADWVEFGYYIIKNHYRLVCLLYDQTAVYGAQEHIKNSLLNGSFRGFVWNKLFRADRLNAYKLSFAKDIHVFEDALFVYQYLLKADKICVIPDCLYYYDMSRSGNVSTRVSRNLLHNLNVITCFENVTIAELEQGRSENLLLKIVIYRLFSTFFLYKYAAAYFFNRTATRVLTDFVQDPRLRNYLIYFAESRQGFLLEKISCRLMLKNVWLFKLFITPCYYLKKSWNFIYNFSL